MARSLHAPWIRKQGSRTLEEHRILKALMAVAILLGGLTAVTLLIDFCLARIVHAVL